MNTRIMMLVVISVIFFCFNCSSAPTTVTPQQIAECPESFVARYDPANLETMIPNDITEENLDIIAALTKMPQSCYALKSQYDSKKEVIEQSITAIAFARGVSRVSYGLRYEIYTYTCKGSNPSEKELAFKGIPQDYVMYYNKDSANDEFRGSDLYIKCYTAGKKYTVTFGYPM